ncbi:extracellular catalytic domain type 1 short-chain-length polyhydroxyalkanoate depolymerase [Aquabacterium sp. OR-4]|uniref:extracellular catalytic domain type 1 short-chain-length polyhydroxyalkanoate depolymerase n=1 Tax=Aquabacterium sp. OR-4 TaxID=2978127 RepID=UPI0021B493E8|nr:PHB depolymerase family esterase [Aquabacterium sp. OR-4]MDT7835056.1 PHB depolymerase family esterase [Aquabacterium sp. OR-4]
MAKRRSRRSPAATSLGAAAVLGRSGLAMAQQLRRASSAALKPWLKGWQDGLDARRDKWLHDHRPPPASGQWVRGVAAVAAGLRQFQLYLPAGRPPAGAWPLMVMLHGCQQDAATFAHSTRMHRLADREAFAVLYLQQDRHANAQGCWNWFAVRNGRAAQEARLVLAAIDQACLLHGVDRERVAVAGLSAGAGLAALLAQQHGERFRAVIMHSGVPPGLTHDARGALAAMQGRAPGGAAPAAAVAPGAGSSGLAAGLMPGLAPGASPRAEPAWPPLLVIHGDRDTVVSPRNAQQAVAQWAVAGQGRALATRQQQRGKRLPMAVTRWVRRGGADVATLVLVQGLGHAWSGGVASLPFGEPGGPDASTLAWRFAQRQWRHGG